MTLLMRDREKIEEGNRYGDDRRLVRAVQKSMEKYHVSLEDACDGCDATIEEYNEAVKLLEKEDEI